MLVSFLVPLMSLSEAVYACLISNAQIVSQKNAYLKIYERKNMNYIPVVQSTLYSDTNS